MRLLALLPGTLSRPIQRLTVSLLGLAAVGAVLAPAGCGGATRGAPLIGGESHFLHWCGDAGGCGEDGLECISGLCTHPCVVAEPNACSAFTSSSCTSQSIEPGAVAVCDMSCSRDADCATLGSGYGCDAGFCRAPDSSAIGSGGTGGQVPGMSPAGGSGGTGTPPLACLDCLASTLKWADVGGFPGTRHHSTDLSNCKTYHHEIVQGPGFDDGTDTPLPDLPQCLSLVDGCPSLTLAELDGALQHPDVRAALAAHTLFGIDGRTYDDTVLQISVGDDSFLVGAACGARAGGCIEIPGAVSLLITRLRALDAAQLSEAPCSSAFPDGATGN